MILSRTPLSLSFFGNAIGNNIGNASGQAGSVGLAAAITRYVDVECRLGAEGGAGSLRLADFSRPRTGPERDADKLDTARCRLNITRDAQVSRHEDALFKSIGDGWLGEQNAAFDVGLLHALHALSGRRPRPRRLAYESMSLAVSQGEGCSASHVAAAGGGMQRVEFLANGAFQTRRIEIAPERARELNACLLLLAVHPRPSGLRSASPTSAWPSGLRLTGLADEAITLLQSSQDILAVGDLMREAWRATFAQAGPHDFSVVRGLYAQARQQGAAGGSLLCGGRLLLLCAPPDTHAAIASELSGVTPVPFCFDAQGSRIVRYAPQPTEAAPPQSRLSFFAPAPPMAMPQYAQAA